MSDVKAPGTGPDQAVAEANAWAIANALCAMKYGLTSHADITTAKLKTPLSTANYGTAANPIVWVSGVWEFDCTPPENPGDKPPAPPPGPWARVGFVLTAVAAGLKVAADVFKGAETGDTGSLEEDVEEAKQAITSGAP